MALVVDGGGLVNKGGALGTGAACCCNKCSGPCPNGVSECAPGCGCSDSQCVPCSGPCDAENPCPAGCACVDGACVADSGACCYCANSNYGFAPSANIYYEDYCTEAEAIARLAVLQAAWDANAPDAQDALEANGYSCVRTVGTAAAERFDGLQCEGGEYWNAILGRGVLGDCCGTVDFEAEPVWTDQQFFDAIGQSGNAGYNIVFPCIGPYTNFTCTDGVQPENCCAENHHPGKTCAQNPCVVIESCVAINGCTSDSDCVFQGQDDLAPAGCYCLGYFPAANGEPEQLGTCNANEFP